MSNMPVSTRALSGKLSNPWLVFLVFALIVLITNGSIAYFRDNLFRFYQPGYYSLLGIAWVALLIRLRFDAVIIALSLLSMTLSLLYTGRRDPIMDTYDGGGHYDYIFYVQRHWYPRLPYDGWQSQHPPLYYYLAALVHSTGIGLHLYNLAGLKLFTAVCMRVFFLFGLLTIRLKVRTKSIQWLCSAMLLFWPMFLIVGGFINNEPLSYSFCAAAIYFLFRWRTDNFRPEWLGTALCACALMMLTKTNAVIPLAAIGLTGLYAIVRGHIPFSSLWRWQILCPVLLVLIAASYSFGRIIYYVPDPVSIFSPNVEWDPSRSMITQKRSFHSLLYFDIGRYLINSKVGRIEHVSFWNSYLVQLINTPYNTGMNLWPHYGRVFLLCWIGMLAYGCTVLYRARAFPLMLLTCTLLAVAAQWGFYASVMTNPSMHPRYTMPFIIALLTLQGVVIERTHQLGYLRFSRSLTLLAFSYAVGIIAQMAVAVYLKV